MSSPDQNKAERNRWDRFLSRRLQRWVDGQPFPADARGRLMQAAADPQAPASAERREPWTRVAYRRIARYLPRREQVPFPVEEFVSSVTISSPMIPGFAFCS